MKTLGGVAGTNTAIDWRGEERRGERSGEERE